jgi:hypothetical protein
MKKHLVTILFALALTPVACGDDKTLGPAPSDCDEVRPTTGQLELLVTISTEFRTVPVTIFEGDIDRNNILIEDTLGRGSFSWDVTADQDYSATAQYVIGADTVLAVGSTGVSPSSEEFEDATCFDPAHGTIDLQLRVRP